MSFVGNEPFPAILESGREDTSRLQRTQELAEKERWNVPSDKDRGIMQDGTEKKILHIVRRENVEVGYETDNYN